MYILTRKTGKYFLTRNITRKGHMLEVLMQYGQTCNVKTDLCHQVDEHWKLYIQNDKDQQLDSIEKKPKGP